MSLPVNIVSSFTLENWTHETPWTTGIGGSETSHIEMALRLSESHSINSFIPSGKKKYSTDHISWQDTENYKPTRGVTIIYRDPKLFDLPKPKGAIWWFVAQDVDYEGLWTEERLNNVDRYLCLCKDHANYTVTKYPSLKDRIFITSNGIRSSYIKSILTSDKRDSNRLFYPSSPDRGLKFLLKQWFRIREINPRATLHVAYGFNNMEAIVNAVGKDDWRYRYQLELQELGKQDGVTFTGRLPQSQIYEEWLQTNIWAHPTDFPETNCITCMEAQALGAWPVTNALWALKDNVEYGWMVDGIPQKSPLVRSNWLHSLEQAFNSRNEKERAEMQKWALARHDWDNVLRQWNTWIQEDLARGK